MERPTETLISDKELSTNMRVSWISGVIVFNVLFYILFFLIASNASAEENHAYEQGIVKQTGIWSVLNVPVCWRQDYSNFSEEKKMVERIIHDTIEADSAYRLGNSLQGWPVCNDEKQGLIEITVEDSNPRSEVGAGSAIGRFGHEVASPTHMWLNFTFLKWSPACGSENRDFHKNCIEVIAVHEMLHALGFYHEQYNTNISDKNPDCFKRLYKVGQILSDVAEQQFKNEQRSLSEARSVTEYDASSMVNYCKDIYRSPPTLSDLDKKTLKYLENITQCKMSGHSYCTR